MRLQGMPPVSRFTISAGKAAVKGAAQQVLAVALKKPLDLRRG